MMLFQLFQLQLPEGFFEGVDVGPGWLIDEPRCECGCSAKDHSVGYTQGGVYKISWAHCFQCPWDWDYGNRRCEGFWRAS